MDAEIATTRKEQAPDANYDMPQTFKLPCGCRFDIWKQASEKVGDHYIPRPWRTEFTRCLYHGRRIERGGPTMNVPELLGALLLHESGRNYLEAKELHKEIEALEKARMKESARADVNQRNHAALEVRCGELAEECDRLMARLSDRAEAHAHAERTFIDTTSGWLESVGIHSFTDTDRITNAMTYASDLITHLVRLLTAKAGRRWWKPWTWFRKGGCQPELRAYRNALHEVKGQIAEIRDIIGFHWSGNLDKGTTTLEAVRRYVTETQEANAALLEAKTNAERVADEARANEKVWRKKLTQIDDVVGAAPGLPTVDAVKMTKAVLQEIQQKLVQLRGHARVAEQIGSCADHPDECDDLCEFAHLVLYATIRALNGLPASLAWNLPGR